MSYHPLHSWTHPPRRSITWMPFECIICTMHQGWWPGRTLGLGGRSEWRRDGQVESGGRCENPFHLAPPITQLVSTGSCDSRFRCCQVDSTPSLRDSREGQPGLPPALTLTPDSGRRVCTSRQGKLVSQTTWLCLVLSSLSPSCQPVLQGTLITDRDSREGFPRRGSHMTRPQGVAPTLALQSGLPAPPAGVELPCMLWSVCMFVCGGHSRGRGEWTSGGMCSRLLKEANSRFS